MAAEEMGTGGTSEVPNTEQFKEMVRQEWTDPATVAAWRRWHPKMVLEGEHSTQALLEHADIQPGMQVLDLASGSGDPAISIAGMVGGGHVTASDLSAEMLEVCEENARQAGRANMSFLQADAESLPFADSAFDRVTSRLGMMYFVDAQKALEEIKRVLKPEGIAAFLVWGPVEESPLLSHLLSPFFKRLNPPPPPAGAPTPVRFAPNGALSGELGTAGFRDVREERPSVILPWPGPPEELWQHLYDVAVPMRPLFDGLPPDERAKAVAEVVAGYANYYDGQRANVPASVVVASGRK